MIVLAAVAAGVIALFGVSASTLALRDLALLEAQQAAQQAALAAAGRASFAAVSGATDAEQDAIAQSEAQAIATANVARTTLGSVVAVRTSTTTELVHIELDLTAGYSGLAGSGTLAAHAIASVPRSGP